MIVSRAVVVGCGGIGRHFIPVIASVLEKPMLLIDGDKYEPKNSARQMVPREWMGQNKAVCLLADLGARGMLLNGNVYPNYIIDSEHFASMLVRGAADFPKDSVQIVAMCVDNDATRNIVYESVRMVRTNVIVVDMANERHNGDVIVWGWVEGQNVGPYPPDMYSNIKNPTDRPPGTSCMQEISQGDTQIITTNMMAACLGAEIVRRIQADESIAPQLMFDFNGDKIAWRM
jgi:hypothetical protein